MRRDGESRRHCPGLGGREVDARGIPPAPQAAKYVDLPARSKVGLVRTGAAVDGADGVEHPSDWRFEGLVHFRALGAHCAGRQQRGIGMAQRGSRLGHARCGLREVEILFKGQGDEARQPGIVEPRPPRLEVRLGLDRTALDARLTQKAA